MGTRAESQFFVCGTINWWKEGIMFRKTPQDLVCKKSTFWARTMVRAARAWRRIGSILDMLSDISFMLLTGNPPPPSYRKKDNDI